MLSRPESLPKAAAPGSSGAEADAHLGFWRNPKRFNVAITRAKALLVCFWAAVRVQGLGLRQCSARASPGVCRGLFPVMLHCRSCSP